MRRRLLLVVLVALVPAGVASAAKPASWAVAEIRFLGQDPAAFRADDTVTRGELAELLAAATGTEPAAIAKPEVPLTMQDLDARVVAALGLTPQAKAFAAGGVWSTDAAWWALLVALVLTWVSALDYARAAPRLFRGRAAA